MYDIVAKGTPPIAPTRVLRGAERGPPGAKRGAPRRC